MPFAGHPTLGTAHVCRALGLGGDSLRLEMQAGLIGERPLWIKAGKEQLVDVLDIGRGGVDLN